MEVVSFVILHYLSMDVTDACVESIITNIQYENYYIIIVDNGSPNNTGNMLKEKYKNLKNIIVILSKDNKGFANGNNLGYIYAREQLHSNYVVITNSDTIFEQKFFVQEIQTIYREKHYHILGPDLITPSGNHQNPHRNEPLSKRQAQKMLFTKSVFLYYFRAKKLLRLNDRIHILEDWFNKKDQKNRGRILYKKEKQGVVLQGACLIFSPSFLEKEKRAFYPKTFMYGEEDILTYLSLKKGYIILYSPAIKVLHLDGETTKNRYNKTLEKNIFTYQYIVEGCKLLLELMKEAVED